MKLSATKLGKMIGLSGEEVNKKLASLGYLKGVPGDWGITEKGKQFGELRYKDNGYGGYAARSWSYIVWDDSLASKLGDPKARLKEVNKNRKLAGLDQLKSLLE